MIVEMTLPHWKKASLALACAALLTACGGGSSNPSDEGGNTPGGEDHHGHIDTAGRLVVLETNSNQVHVVDLDDGRVIQSYTADHPPSAVYASPDKRYALLVQRMQDQIQFVDGGIYQEPHNDHMDDRKEAPALLPTRLTGARPTHYEVHDGLAAVFFDGDAETGRNASLTILSDQSIGANAPELASQRLALPMHGTAEPRGDWLLTTWRAEGTESTLPSQVELHERHGDHFHHVQRFAPECPGLHGSYSNANYTAFGCTDGVLVVHQNGNDFTAQKINNPPDLGEGVRIGTITGNHHMGNFVGLASGRMFEINPVAGTITRIEWADGERIFRAGAIDSEGENLLALDDVGTLHILSTNGWRKRAELSALIADMPQAAPYPTVVVSGEDDKAWVSDPKGQRLHTVDIDDAQLRDSIALNFNPGGMAWVGIAEHQH